MNILLTGSRAPVALDLSRRFHQAGHTVFHADSLKNGIGMQSNSAAKSFLVPRPVDSPRAYAESLAAIVDRESVDWVIPTCEEVFFIAAYRSLLNCQVLVDDFDRLTRIHNKYSFSQFAGNEFAQTPETVLLNDPLTSDAAGFPAGESFSEWVFKPVWSRFASRTLIGPSVEAVRELRPSAADPWIAQRRIRGTEYSTYSVARRGRLLAHVTYHSLYRAGVGSGICFHAVERLAIEQFVRQFVETECYTGQIGFDLIEEAGGACWVLEGNPRATSGVHLFDPGNALGNALLDVQGHLQVVVQGDLQVNPQAGTNPDDSVLKPSSSRPAMVEFAMPLWGLYDGIRGGRLLSFLPDLLRSRWTIASLRDPGPVLGLPRAFWSIAAVAIRERRTLQQASTFDIEWNGGPM